MASLWISLGSLWVTPQFTVTCVAADGPVLVCHPQPGSPLPPSSLPQAPRALPFVGSPVGGTAVSVRVCLLTCGCLAPALCLLVPSQQALCGV